MNDIGSKFKFPPLHTSVLQKSFIKATFRSVIVEISVGPMREDHLIQTEKLHYELGLNFNLQALDTTESQNRRVKSTFCSRGTLQIPFGFEYKARTE